MQTLKGMTVVRIERTPTVGKERKMVSVLQETMVCRRVDWRKGGRVLVLSHPTLTRREAVADCGAQASGGPLLKFLPLLRTEGPQQGIEDGSQRVGGGIWEPEGGPGGRDTEGVIESPPFLLLLLERPPEEDLGRAAHLNELLRGNEQELRLGEGQVVDELVGGVSGRGDRRPKRPDGLLDRGDDGPGEPAYRR